MAVLFKKNLANASNAAGAEFYALFARYNGFDDLEKGLIEQSLAAFLKYEEAWKLLDIVEPKQEE